MIGQIANKVVNGKQATVAWYVDDNILAHKDPKVRDGIIADIEK